MARIRRGARGLSEIVGTLMLIVIVVTAATALAAFVAVYQKQVQAQEAYEQERALEDLHILSVVPNLNASGETIDSVNFTVASLDVNPTTISSIMIDGQAIAQYQAYELDTTSGLYTKTTVAAGGDLVLGPQDLLQVIVNDSRPSGLFSFFDASFQLRPTSYIEVSLFTTYDNDFTQTFVPPTAVALVSGLAIFTGTGYETLPELDGSQSFQTGNGTLVSWSWSVTTNNVSCPALAPLLGEKVVPTIACNATEYDFLLTVRNSYGLAGTSSVSYLSP